MLPDLEGHDWAEVFGEPESYGGNGPLVPNKRPGSDVSTNTFTREDVTFIGGMVEGDYDGPDWVVYGQLRDGRWFVARGGCDYTGWDCQSGISADVAETLDYLIRYGMSVDERRRFGLQLEDEE